MAWRPAALASAALLAIVIVVGVLLLRRSPSEHRGAEGALATESTRRASGIQIGSDERLLWGNLVVHATGDETVELLDVELLRASKGLRLRRALVADGRRPQARLLVFGEGAFEQLPDVNAWNRSLHPLAGYEVQPVGGPWRPVAENLVTRDGRLRDTEIVLEFEPVGSGRFQVRGGVRLRYRVGDAESHIDLPNQLSVCAPLPCKVARPEGL